MKSLSLSRRLAAVLAAAALAGAAFAQDATKPDAKPEAKQDAPAKSEATLKAGDKAPPLKIEKWLKGDAVAEFKPGKTYVVEFWATWCGPCIASMPHISELQAQYKDKVTIIGTNVWEKYGDDTLEKVKKFVADQGDNMAYTVAYDGDGKATDQAYMKAAKRNGIPCSFVVDGTGTIAWIGHPMWLDAVLAPVVAGKWDAKTGPDKIAAAEKTLRDTMMKLRDDPKEALAAWETFAKEYPHVASMQNSTVFRALIAAQNYEKAYKIAGELVTEAIAKKNAQTLNEIAWTIVDPEGAVEKKDLDLAMKAAVKADEFTQSRDAAIIDTLARVHFLKGDTKKAIELQTKAVELAPEEMKEELEKTLKTYKEKSGKPE